jgi:hypothetical protein
MGRCAATSHHYRDAAGQRTGQKKRKLFWAAQKTADKIAEINQARLGDTTESQMGPYENPSGTGI